MQRETTDYIMASSTFVVYITHRCARKCWPCKVVFAIVSVDRAFMRRTSVISPPSGLFPGNVVLVN